jgi:hypothetical protein
VDHDVDATDQADVGAVVLGEEVARIFKGSSSSRHNLALWTFGEEFDELGILLLVDGQIGEGILVQCLYFLLGERILLGISILWAVA